jgi:penicillin-binding protein 1A
MWRKIIYVLVFLLLVAAVATAGIVTWGYYYITRDLPQLSTISGYSPAAATKVFSADGVQIAEFYRERRYPVKIADVPEVVKQAFLAAEDASFYQHKGIDYVSILRAIQKNFSTGKLRQGGSTITQQVVKNLLLSRERSFKRKAKEAILSFHLEQRFTKDEIFEIYLNEIFFGNNAYGIKAAARAYFQKDLQELTLGEAAMLGGLPKAPSFYSPLVDMPRARERQRYVLDQMVKAGWADPEEAKKAAAEAPKVYFWKPETIFASPFYATEVRRIFTESPQWKGYDIDADGLTIFTAVDTKADRLASHALQQTLREVDKRRGWRGPIGFIADRDPKSFVREYASQITDLPLLDTVYPALVTEVSKANGVTLDLGHFVATLDLRGSQWARRRLDANGRVSSAAPESTLRVGDVIEVLLVAAESASKAAAKADGEQPPFAPWDRQPADLGLSRVVIDQTPELEGSLVLLDPHSGKVVVTTGGYSFQRSQFNRVTQALRQPGSTFKPVVYLAAVDGFRYTPATIVHDTPRTFKVGDELWTPSNFDESFLGDITLRTALEKSRNLVSADIISQINIDSVIQYAKRMGIESKLGRNPSLSLGSSEVTMLELARAYGVFPAKGVLFDSVFITKVLDRNGAVLYDYESEKLTKARQVIDESSAFIMANMMKGVVQYGTGYRIKELGRPAAGKTGTSNDQMDAWFVGYTPDWVCGVWIGFDVKRSIGDKETGGRVAAPAFLYFMRDFLRYQDEVAYKNLTEDAKAEAAKLGIEYTPPDPIQPLDFAVPDGVEPYWIDKATGVAVSSKSPGAFLEYFARGTEPNKPAEEVEATRSYLESPEL